MTGPSRRIHSMTSLDATCWTLIEGAASGRAADRDEFARRYLPAVQAYLLARWRESPLVQERDDAVQEVFVECFRQGGALERVDRDRDGGFRAFLYGVARNIARRVECRKARRKEIQAASASDLDRVETDDLTLSRVFDRAWALALLQEALRVQARRAKSAGEAALRRIELRQRQERK